MAAFDPGSNEFLGAIAGSLLGGFMALGGVWLTFRQQRKAKEHADLQATRNLLLSIQDEINALLLMYQTSVRESLLTLQDGQPLMIVWPVTHERFSVYDANTAALGSIADDDLRSNIVRFYIMVGGLIATYKFNSELVGRFENFDFLSRQTGSQEARVQANGVIRQLVEYAPKIKIRDQLTVALAAEVIAAIRVYLDAHPVPR